MARSDSRYRQNHGQIRTHLISTIIKRGFMGIDALSESRTMNFSATQLLEGEHA